MSYGDDRLPWNAQLKPINLIISIHQQYPDTEFLNQRGGPPFIRKLPELRRIRDGDPQDIAV